MPRASTSKSGQSHSQRQASSSQSQRHANSSQSQRHASSSQSQRHANSSQSQRHGNSSQSQRHSKSHAGPSQKRGHGGHGGHGSHRSRMSMMDFFGQMFDSDDDDLDSSDSDEQPTLTQSSKKKGPSNAELDALTSSAILYILRASKTKTHILKSNITKTVMQGSKYHVQVMAQVKEQLLKIFGYNLWEFEGGKYILTNTIPNTIPHITLTDEEKRKKVLLFLILAHIFMSEDACLEDNLYTFLDFLGINTCEYEPDVYFGDVRKILKEEFVPQRYIDRIKESDRESEYFQLRWGVRAEQELKLRHVLTFVEKVYNVPMAAFKKQHQAMLAREKLDEQQNQPRGHA